MFVFKANPAMKTAVKSVRDGGKLAYKEMKHKIRENQSRKTFSGSKKLPVSFGRFRVEISTQPEG